MKAVEIVKFIFPIIVVLQFSCYTQKSPKEDIDIEISTVLEKDNYWKKKNHWGNEHRYIDYNSKTPLAEDSRVDDLYKINFPEFTKNYVLYRVGHGHSCWIYTALVLLVYQLIDSGEANFAAAIKKFEELGESNRKYPHFRDFYVSGKFKKFIDAFKYFNADMNFKNAMGFINHTNTEKILNEGLRAYIAANLRSIGLGNPEEIEKDSKCWGHVADADFLANLAKVEFAGFYLQGNNIDFKHKERDEIINADPNIKELERREKKGEQIADEIWSKALDAAIDTYFKNDPKKPKVLFFRSKPHYMDVAVFRPLADEINQPNSEI